MMSTAMIVQMRAGTAECERYLASLRGMEWYALRGGMAAGGFAGGSGSSVRRHHPQRPRP